MTVQEDLPALLATIKWVPHIVKNGSRQHVSALGLFEDARNSTAVTWCSEPFCENNRREVLALDALGVDALAAQPPSALREALKSLTKDQP